MDNFKAPYFSTNIKEFWSKWHISLSSWFKDYIYIPLGGNRCSKIKHYSNLFITFLISGLWHGANITFVIWGGLNGLLQIFEDIFNIKKIKNVYSPLWFIKVIITFTIMTLTWIFFRAQNINEAIYVFNNMFIGIDNFKNYIVSGLYSFDVTPLNLIIHLIIYLVPLTIIDCLSVKYNVIELINKKPTIVRYSLYFGLVIVVLLLHYVGEVNFIYFQF